MSMLARLVSAGVGPKTYVDDLFAANVWDGTGAQQTITNGVDLAGNGGIVWVKSRNSSSGNHFIQHNTIGALKTNTQDGFQSASSIIPTFNSNGFEAGVGLSTSSVLYSSWTFRKAASFLDVVEYTGNGAGTRTINHSLGTNVGMVLVKRTDAAAPWRVWHFQNTAGTNLELNSNAVSASYNSKISSANSTSFSLSESINDYVNAASGSYVAYIFARAGEHVLCDFYTGNGSAAGPFVQLGFEPQFLLIKCESGATGSWFIYDTLRGPAHALWADQTTQEGAHKSGTLVQIESDGFRILTADGELNASGNRYVYMAIRRSNKPPTSGTQVFQPTRYTGTNTDNALINTGIFTDMVMLRQRNGSGTGYEGFVLADRPRANAFLKTSAPQAEQSPADGLDAQLVSTTEFGNAFTSMSGVWAGNNSGASQTAANINANASALNHIALAFKRAARFFDVITWTGDGVDGRSIWHNLTVKPDFVFYSTRDQAQIGLIASSHLPLSGGKWLGGFVSSSGGFSQANIYNTTTTNSYLSVDSGASANSSGVKYVAYLFASLPGICKSGIYTGNGGTANSAGTSQTIDCGFTAGARFLLIKANATTTGSNWYVFDTARGIVAGNDPYLLLDGTSAELSVDVIDPANAGFIVNQTASHNLNVTGTTYLYLAIA